MKKLRFRSVVLIFISFIFFYGCNNPLKNSIFDELEITEIKKIVDKDSLFYQTYKLITHINDYVLVSDVEKAKYNDLTYERVHEFVKYTNSMDFALIVNEFDVDWKNKYGVLHTKVDSISDYHKKLVNYDSIIQYLTSNKNSSWDSSRYYGYFGYYHLENDIENILYKKDYLNDEISRYEKYVKNNYHIFNETLLRLKNENKYYLNIPDSLIISMKKYLNTEESLKEYWSVEHENHSFEKNSCIEEILTNILNLEYIPLYVYKNNEIRRILKEKDNLVFNFIEEAEDLSIDIIPF